MKKYLLSFFLLLVGSSAALSEEQAAFRNDTLYTVYYRTNQEDTFSVEKCIIGKLVSLHGKKFLEVKTSYASQRTPGFIEFDSIVAIIPADVPQQGRDIDHASEGAGNLI